MAKAFDAAGKELIDRDPLAWLALAGLPAPAGPGAVKPGNVDLSGYTAAADTMLRVKGMNGRPSYTAHLEIQSGPDPDLDTRVLLYHVLGGRKYGWPVASVVFLLRPGTQTRVTGRVRHRFAPDSKLDFTYRSCGFGNCRQSDSWKAGSARCHWHRSRRWPTRGGTFRASTVGSGSAWRKRRLMRRKTCGG